VEAISFGKVRNAGRTSIILGLAANPPLTFPGEGQRAAVGGPKHSVKKGRSVGHGRSANHEIKIASPIGSLCRERQKILHLHQRKAMVNTTLGALGH
jgi:hypothetical protein